MWSGSETSTPLETLVFDDLPRLALTITAPSAQAASASGTDGGHAARDTLCLFLHGIGGGRTNWLSQLQTVGRIMPAAALDLRGYGDSTLGPRQSTVDDYCADILRVAEKLGAKRLVLVGLSSLKIR